MSARVIAAVRDSLFAAQEALEKLAVSSAPAAEAHTLIEAALLDLAELDETDEGGPMTDDEDDGPVDCVFSLDDGLPFTGQSCGDKWNGFDVVYVSSDTLERFLAHVATMPGYAGEQAEADAKRLREQAETDGHAELRGFAITIHEGE